LLAFDLAVTLAIGWHGEFPLSDDWAYAWPVRSLCEAGTVDLLPWTGASIVAQVGYGAALCKLFGFSFETLRVSTLVLGAAADVGVLLLARRSGLSPALAFLAALTFAVSPLRVHLGFTFMSDLPFTAFVVWAAYFYARGLGARRVGLLVAGSVLAAIATLVRQHGVFVAGAAALAALVPALARDAYDQTGFVTRLRDAVACTAVPIVVVGIYYYWLFALHGAPEAVARKAAEATDVGLLAIANLAFRAVETLGLLLLPLAAVAFAASARAAPRRLLTAISLLTAAAAFLLLREQASMPYLPNVIHDTGVGALTLRDTLHLGMPAPYALGAVFRAPLTVVATLAAAAVLTTWAGGIGSIARGENDAGRFVLLALILLFAGSLLHRQYYFDRYLLPILPFACVLTMTTIKRMRTEGAPFAWVVASLATLVLAWFSVAGTHDYLAWNRARYAQLDELAAGGIAPERIDGGMEFNAWHLAKASGYAPTDAEVKIGQSERQKSWWWVVDDEFVIAMQPLEGYAIRARRPYRRWLVPGEGAVYTLERATPAESRAHAPD
jgi:hypothetical protein